MTRLSHQKMESVCASGSNLLDWVCGGVGTVGLLRGVATMAGRSIALGPAGTAISVGCGVYGVGKLFDWW